jgi:phosphoribosylanthranilate isomerase
MKVKICGITTVSDALLAAELGADSIGVVFWPSSPRFVEPTRARAIVKSLPAGVTAVGVFVNQTAEAAAIAQEIGLGAVQLHGDEPAEDYAGFPVPVIKAMAVKGIETVDEATAIPPNVTILLDAHDPIRRGGTGTVIDWSIAGAIARLRPVILSGGLAADNVAAAIVAVRPFGIDVSSGVEAEPGRKDLGKLRALFAALNGVQETR